MSLSIIISLLLAFYRLRELANIDDLTTDQIAEMDKRLAQISRTTNQYRPEIAEGLNVLVASGQT